VKRDGDGARVRGRATAESPTDTRRTSSNPGFIRPILSSLGAVLTEANPEVQAVPHDIAFGEFERCSGTQFDPEIVEVFLAHIEEDRRLENAAGRVVPR